MLKISSIETLRVRREKAFEKFAVYNVKNAHFSPKRFALNVKNNEMSLRTTEMYIIQKSNYDRMKKKPLNCMRELLNKLEMHTKPTENEKN